LNRSDINGAVIVLLFFVFLMIGTLVWVAVTLSNTESTVVEGTIVDISYPSMRGGATQLDMKDGHVVLIRGVTDKFSVGQTVRLKLERVVGYALWHLKGWGVIENVE